MRTLRDAAEDTDTQAAGALRQAVHRALVGVMLTAEGDAKRNATDRPKVRSGALRRSIAGGVTDTGTGVELSLSAGQDGPAERYAKLQEEGGTVRPKRGRFLAIPVGAALTASGVARYRSPCDVAGLRFVPIRGGASGLLVRDVGERNARSDVLFVLVRQVEIQPTRFIGRAWAEAVPRSREAVEVALRGVTRGAD